MRRYQWSDNKRRVTQTVQPIVSVARGDRQGPFSFPKVKRNESQEKSEKSELLHHFPPRAHLFLPVMPAGQTEGSQSGNHRFPRGHEGQHDGTAARQVSLSTQFTDSIERGVYTSGHKRPLVGASGAAGSPWQVLSC